jgi:hypothetical protein
MDLFFNAVVFHADADKVRKMEGTGSGRTQLSYLFRLCGVALSILELVNRGHDNRYDLKPPTKETAGFSHRSGFATGAARPLARRAVPVKHNK